MIADVYGENVRSQLNINTLSDYWQEYFYYRDNASQLHNLVQEKLIEEVENAREMEEPFIDSQQSINRILTEFGDQHNFHRQFSEQLPDFHSNQILGMHLYDIMVNDEEVWRYKETQPRGHQFAHATYFK